MSGDGRALAGQVYDELVAVVATLDEAAGWAPTGCAGWCVRDLVAHLLDDVRRALVALGTPAAGPPASDAVSYWGPWRPGTAAPDAERRAVRIVASTYPSVEPLAAQYIAAVAALRHLGAGVAAGTVLSTQGTTVSVEDLFHTLAVEATVHHVDLVAYLDGVPEPSGPGPAAVREVLDGLLGGPVPVVWDDLAYLRAGTGRAALTAPEKDLLGADVDRFPLLG